MGAVNFSQVRVDEADGVFLFRLPPHQKDDSVQKMASGIMKRDGMPAGSRIPADMGTRREGLSIKHPGRSAVNAGGSENNSLPFQRNVRVNRKYGPNRWVGNTRRRFGRRR
jgi:hypothetical protein